MKQLIIVIFLLVGASFQTEFPKKVKFDKCTVFYKTEVRNCGLFIKSKIVDHSNQSPILNVNIYNPLTYEGTVPNPKNNGLFELCIKSQDKVNVVFHKPGYLNDTLSIR